MMQFLVPLAAAAAGGYLFVTRGKAHIGDAVEVNYKPGGQYGEQALQLQGRVVKKTNPILGPYYSVQLYQLPKVPAPKGLDELLGVSPELAALSNAVPSTLEGLRDKDIIRNLSRQ